LHKRNSADAVAVNQEAKATRPRSNAPRHARAWPGHPCRSASAGCADGL